MLPNVQITNTVPALPDHEPLTLAHKNLVEEALRQYPPESSELTFTNLFAWRTTHPVLLTRIGESLWFYRNNPETKGALLPPVGPVRRGELEQALDWVREIGGNPVFRYVPGRLAMLMHNIWPDLKLEPVRGDFDYLYHRRDLATLEGRKYDGKRNLVKQFHSGVQADYRRIDEEILPLCADAQALWCDRKSCSDNPGLDAEDAAVNEILEHWNELTVFGGAYLVAGDVIGFAAAEELAPGTAVIHVEKGNTDYPGIYQALNRKFCADELAQFEYVNREQDLGVPGLRKAKQSYHPIRFVEKYELKLDG